MAQIYYMGVPYGGRTTGGGSGDAYWGNIGGVLANQTDLKTALDAKSAVTANPTLVGTEDNLTSVEIDGTKYGISGGGSSSVIVNPIVTASTDELDSIGIDSASYDLYNSDDNRFYKPMYHDIHVIPDKHNTGCNESSLSTYDSSVTNYDGVSLEYRSDMNSIVANFNGANKSLLGTHTIEDIDFSAYPFNLYMVESYSGNGAKVIFNNCKFLTMTNDQIKDGLTFEFNDCSFNWSGGNNATFNRCFIGHTSGDACNVNTNCVLNDCYIADVVQLEIEQGTGHIDGIQIHQGGNCILNNCRIEAPDINYSAKIGDLSYALYFEGSPNCEAKHSVINGGGYYTISISGTDTCKITDAIIGANGGSTFYPNEYTESSTINPNIADSLYVTSVWKESNVLHFLVTNDTMVDRVLDVVTPNGVTSFNVSRNYRPSDYEVDTKDFDDLPIDVEYTINENAAYAVFYESGRQIRFANFTQERISKKDLNTLKSNVSWSQILASGTKIGTITINGTPTNVYAPSGSAETIPNIRWQEESGTIHAGSLYSITGKEVWDRDASLYSCLEYTFTGDEQKLKVSGQDCGMNYYRSYAIVDAEYNLLAEPTEEWQNGRTDSNLVIDIPNGAYKIFLNGSNYQAPYLEVALIDVRSDLSTLDKFLKGISEKIKYRKTFAWKPMPTGLFAFTFDDSIAETDQIVDDMIDVGAPACFGAVSSHLNMTCSNTTETITQAMQRMINSAYGGEVLNHGGYTVTIANIDNLNYLYEKFVVDRQKFRDVGFDVRGIVRSGESDGQGNPCLDNDPRTDVWVRLLYDYSDLYGVHEPYNHARYSIASNSTLADMKAMVDSVIQNKTFCPILFHNPYTLNWDFKELAEYILDQGGQIVTYAYAYDNYGSDAETIDILRRITALEGGSTPTLTSITATKTTTAYSVGDSLSTADITVTAHYSDSSTEDVTSSATINANNVDMSTAGTYSISVSYLTASTTISISVSAVAKVLDSISATKTVTSYAVGDTLSTTDITVTAHYTDSSTDTVTGTFDTSNVNMSTAGTYSIGVSYTENGVTKTTSVSITVTSVSYIIDHATASGSTLAHNATIGPEFTPTSGKTYHVEFDYDFTATTQYSAHTIKIQPYGWAYTDIVAIDSVTGSNTGHASADVTATNSNPVANLLKALLQNTTVTAYSLTNICVWEV